MDNNQFNNQTQNTNPLAKLDKKTLKYAGIGAAALVVLIIIVALIGSMSGGYKKTIKGTIKLVNKKVEGNLPYQEYTQIKEMREYSKLNMEIFDQDDEMWEESIEKLEDEFGDDYKITYKISKSKKLKGDDLDDVVDAVEDSYDAYADLEDSILDTIDNMCEDEDVSSKDQKKLEKQFEKVIKAYDDVKVSAAYEVTLKCTIKGDDGEEDFKLKDVIIAKVNGEWIIVSQNINPSSIALKAITD